MAVRTDMAFNRSSGSKLGADVETPKLARFATFKRVAARRAKSEHLTPELLQPVPLDDLHISVNSQSRTRIERRKRPVDF